MFAVKWTWAAARGSRVFGHRRQTEGKLHWFSTLRSIYVIFSSDSCSFTCLFDIQLMKWQLEVVELQMQFRYNSVTWWLFYKMQIFFGNSLHFFQNSTRFITFNRVLIRPQYLFIFLKSVMSSYIFNSFYSTQGKLEDRKPIMLLFDDVAIDCILSAAQWAQLLLNHLSLLNLLIRWHVFKSLACLCLQVSRWSSYM